jgi:hypothetical protein
MAGKAAHQKNRFQNNREAPPAPEHEDIVGQWCQSDGQAVPWLGSLIATCVDSIKWNCMESSDIIGVELNMLLTLDCPNVAFVSFALRGDGVEQEDTEMSS